MVGRVLSPRVIEDEKPDNYAKNINTFPSGGKVD